MADENLNVELTDEVKAALKEVIRKSGSANKQESLAAMHEIAKAIELPLREGIMSGDIISNIYETIELEPGATPEFPIHWLAPGTEKEYVAYTVPNHGRIPQRYIEGDYVTVPTYDIGASIDWNAKYQRDARWDIVGDATENLRKQFTKKMNDDGMHAVLSAGFDRNIMVFDSDAAASQFTKRLVSLMKLVMRRNGGGNSTSINRFKLTDMLVSPEAQEDMRNWNVDIVDEFTRREIFLADDGALNRIFNVNLIDLDELGQNQEYELYYTSNLGGALPTGDAEIVVGLDLSPSRRAFINPVREALQIFEDDSFKRQRQVGLWGIAEMGWAILDNRPIILGSF